VEKARTHPIQATQKQGIKAGVNRIGGLRMEKGNARVADAQRDGERKKRPH
jgi:hypothetical protein